MPRIWTNLPHYLTVLAFISTGLNLACGFLGILSAIDGNNRAAFQLLLLGAIFDFLDGKFAKLAPTKSDMGTYADSFADVLTFAILPGFMLLYGEMSGKTITYLGRAGYPITVNQVYAAVFAVCGWFRLIKFAIQPTGVVFLGLPAPAAAMLAGSAIIVQEDPLFGVLDNMGIILTVVFLLAGLLMVTTIKYPSPKRMYKSDNILITLSGVVGFLFILIPETLPAFLMMCCGILYMIAGPNYLKKTEEQAKKDDNLDESENQ
ncbi:MAG: CDP-alcohol phosphatidyltransferase family protein [Candidatus Hodarchaeales archaeon]